MPRSPRPEVLTTLDLLGLFDKDSGLPTHSCHPLYRRHARDNIRETLAARTAARLCHKEATLSPAPRYTLAPAAPVAPLKSCLKQPSRGTNKSVSVNTARFSRTIIPCSTSSGAERVDNTFAGVPNHRPAISIRSSLSAESDKAAEFRSFLAGCRARRLARAANHTPYVPRERPARPTLPAPPTSDRPPVEAPPATPHYYSDSVAATLARAQAVSRRVQRTLLEPRCTDLNLAVYARLDRRPT